MASAPASRDLAQLTALDRELLVHPSLHGDAADRYVFVRGEGCLVWDADGREYLDATSGGLCVSQLGHGREDIAAPVTSGEGFFHGFTYYGHPVGCAVAQKSIEILEQEDLPARARAAGELLLAELAPLRELPVVGDLRGRGLLVAVELVRDRSTRVPLISAPGTGVDEVLRREHGVLARLGGPVLSITPALVISDEQLRRVAAALIDTLSRLQPDGTFS